MYDARIRTGLARVLADAYLAGVWEEAALRDRAAGVLGPPPWWVERLTGAVLVTYPRPPADRPRELARFLAGRLAALEAPEEDPGPPRVHRRLIPELAMGRAPWPVPELASVGALADWLGVEAGTLAWLADARSLERHANPEALRNYRYGFLSRPGRPVRVIERPKARLKALQRTVLADLLNRIPVHDAAHGFCRGRSVHSHARAHVGRQVVVHLDLADFFASIPARRIFGIFRTAGCPEPVAHALTGLVTNAVPVDVWAALPRPSDPAQLMAHHHLGRQLATPHLPQGAPTSPALANLAAFSLDRRLSGLADTLGATYTRYADDLVFSGSSRLAGSTGWLRRTVTSIAAEEGFSVNPAKSTLVTRAGSQRVCGVVVNDRLNVPRDEYDRLRATLHNCRRHGPASENRAGVPDFRAHLAGRIAWVVSLNPARGERLLRAFAAIDWTEGGG